MLVPLLVLVPLLLPVLMSLLVPVLVPLPVLAPLQVPLPLPLLAQAQASTMAVLQARAFARIVDAMLVWALAPNLGPIAALPLGQVLPAPLHFRALLHHPSHAGAACCSRRHRL